MTEKKYKVRKLEVRDVFTVGEMLMKAVDDGAKDISNLIKIDETDSGSKKKKNQKNSEDLMIENGAKMASVVMQTCLKYSKGEFLSWLADMAGAKSDDFLHYEVDILFDIYDSITNSKVIGSFFSRALQFAKVMSPQVKSFIARLEEYNIIGDLAKEISKD